MKPNDPTLVGMVTAIVVNSAYTFFGIGQMWLIDKDYRVRRSLWQIGDLARRDANSAREQLLRSGELLAVVTAGWSVGDGGKIVVQHFPAPGQVETFGITYPPPQLTWTDPNSPEMQTALQAYQDIWTLTEMGEQLGGSD